jgi:hypothetical protein
MNAPISVAFAHLSERSQLTRTGFFLKHGIKTIRDIKDLNNTDKWSEIINDTKSINTKNTRVSDIVALVKSEFGRGVTASSFYNDLYARLAAERTDQLMSNKKTTKQESKYGDISYDDIRRIALENIKSNELTTAAFKKLDLAGRLKYFKWLNGIVMILLYIENPVRNDLYQMKMISRVKDVSDDQNSNYWLITSVINEVVLTRYKTRAHYGILRIPIKKYVVLNRLSRQLTVINKLFDSTDDQMFHSVAVGYSRVSQLTEPMALQLLIDATLSVFNRKLSANDFRHLYESNLQMDPSYQLLSEADKAARHRLIQHSTNVAVTYKHI